MLKKFICLIFLVPIYSFADPIVLGYEGPYDGDSNKPLIIQKNLDGTWGKNTRISGLPTDIDHASLHVSSCSNNYCVAMGDYQKNEDDKTLPLILMSNDHGISWIFINKISGIPTYANKTYISDLHCESHICMAAGLIWDDRGSQELQRPLLLISSDNGETWTASNADTVDLMNKSEGRLNSITKSGENWMANGSYEYNGDQSKLFMLSKDNGSTWKEINIENSSIIPPAGGLLFDLTCMNNTCLQLGTDNNDEPLAARSEDNGNTWKIIKNISGGSAYLVENLTCYNDFCVAGDEQSPDAQLIISHDKGQSWKSSQINNKPDDFYGGIKQVSCYNDTMCTAIGSSWNNGHTFPMVITTHDGGATWTYQDNPFIVRGNEFNAIQCILNVCVIVGMKNNSFLILTSQDDGQTWTSENKIIGLPSDSDSGLISFLNAQSGQSMYLKEKRLGASY